MTPNSTRDWTVAATTKVVNFKQITTDGIAVTQR